MTSKEDAIKLIEALCNEVARTSHNPKASEVQLNRAIKEIYQALTGERITLEKAKEIWK